MPIMVVVMIRSTISFFVLLILVRLMGKQQLSQLNFFDYIVGITIGSIASTLSVQVNENSTATIVGMITWTFLAILLAVLGLKNVWIKETVEGEATIVVRNGMILENNLKRLRLTIDELISELRTLDVFDLKDVEFALFESNGRLSVQKKSQKQPLTASDLNIPTSYMGLPTNLIVDGKVLIDALNSLNLSKAWLYHQLKKKNITDSHVSLAQLDTTGKLYVDLIKENQYFIIDTTE